MRLLALAWLIVFVWSTPAAADPPEADDALEGKIEEAEVTGPGGLRIRVAWRTMTGNTHVAESLAIETREGALRFAAATDDDDDDDDASAATPDAERLPQLFDLPLIDRALALGGDRWLLLGWSSHGGGMQTVHAWIVESDHRGPRLLDALTWSTDRSHAGVAIDGRRIGIPFPGARSLHSRGDWGLVLERGGRRLDLEDVERLATTTTPLASLRGFYTPPFNDPPRTRGWSGRFVWFTAGTQLAQVRATPKRKR